MSEKKLTTTAGSPVSDNQNSLTAGAQGPVLMQDWQLVEKLAHQNRERIPERVVHAKGWGAFGTFTVTNDISKYSRAKIFAEVGKTTEMLARFSTVAGEQGAADAERDVRGFALKFYTDEGNWDLVGNNTPVFFVRDPLKFPDFIHTQKRHPRTNLRSPTAMWDFWSLSPESLHQVTILFSDRGLPVAPMFMNGYGSHTYSVWNKAGSSISRPAKAIAITPMRKPPRSSASRARPIRNICSVRSSGANSRPGTSRSRSCRNSTSTGIGTIPST